MKDIFHYQDLPYISEIIYFKIISYYYNDLLASYFEIERIRKLVTRKYL